MRHRFAVSSHGIRVPAGVRDVVDVKIAGERVWSFNPQRERPRFGLRPVPWPTALAPYLDGVADVSLVRHASGETVHRQQVAFGAGAGPVSVVDESGHPVAVDKAGHLQRMFDRTDDDLTSDVLDSVEQVLHDLREACGLDAFLSFGCLLGAVRDGHVIGHDCDADVSYLSRHTHPFDVIRENRRAAETMRSLGWRITRMSAGDFKIWTRPGGGRRVGIDVFAAFHVDDRFYMVPSVAGDLPRSALLPAGKVSLEGRSITAPALPEALLETTYGPNWQVPDPAFEFEPTRATVRRLNGWLRNNRKHLRYWGDFYISRALDRVPTTPSPFATWVADRLEPDQRVLDVGCGNGRDAVFFAQQGHRVTALDGSPRALQLSRRLAGQQGVRVRPTWLNLNDLHSALTTGARLAHAPRRAEVVYARFLLDAIEPDTRQTFWRWARMVQRRGGTTYLEFRTWQGTLRARAFPFHYRTLLDPKQVVAEIEAAGGTVLHREVGKGLAPFDGENPRICRLVVRWS
ncbi:bifunctional 2-polyprenyl-6-hydroxyphenol methylase/3-demethylubiquinol 3-O-methyltransferase UbiG [Nocardioides sp. SR21]|uniref:class I SAM-dependent methyltransferase n=1 Tax=Nocardioides sp. SR21 TaxID=2919501 RepID=UPI001FAACF59|nr:class I SAM-dependent methyltransferase [Nocardioides sp. SR21]